MFERGIFTAVRTTISKSINTKLYSKFLSRPLYHILRTHVTIF